MTTPLDHRRVASLAACLLAFAVVTAWPTSAAAQIASGADVKAAFLLNFAKFVEWPSAGANTEPLVIGVLGNDDLADSLRDIAQSRKGAGRPTSVKRVTQRDDLTRLHILFVAAADSGQIARVIKDIGSASVLTVSDADRFCLLGGIIQFLTEDDRVRFDINLDAAEAGGLVINSKLLALARAVRSTKTQ